MTVDNVEQPKKSEMCRIDGSYAHSIEEKITANLQSETHHPSSLISNNEVIR